MSAGDPEVYGVAFSDGDATGFAEFVRMSAKSPLLTDLAERMACVVDRLGVVFLVNPLEPTPLPPRLSAREVLSEARQMGREHVLTEQDKARFDLATEQGYTLLSWPDQTRVMIRRGKPTAAEAQHIYLAARFNRELGVAVSAEHVMMGGTA